MLKASNVNLARRRSRGLHQISAWLQEFTTTFDRFLKAFSGVVDIAKCVDTQYGNVASATLSLLFATVLIKAEAEKSMNDTIIEITDRLPEFEVYGRIYPDRGFGRILAEAYRDIILFARGVTIYLQGHGVGTIPITIVKDDSDSDSERKSEILLAERIERLEEEHENYCKREDVRIVKELKSMLQLQNYRSENQQNDLKDYAHIVKHRFNSDRRREKMNLHRFSQTDSLQVWEEQGSTLLLLFGRNEVSSESTHHSWLSTVAVEMVETLQLSKKVIAYEMCGESSTLEEGLSRLIVQLLEREPNLIRKAHDFADIESQISLAQSRKSNERATRLSGLRSALLQIVDLHNGRVHIVLNRPDLCNGDDENCLDYIKEFDSLVKEATIELKVLVIVKSEVWDFKSYQREFKSNEARNYFRAVQINQKLY
ncbi:hypothetical protein BS50DRAFT_625007 [Corynespora cassiicola Philippines]|uniref:DUF7708 domain-containing protein n=1 Tax=Corynespora cassiicola Philippines TaxID=1448308 RepID=A0A2T2NA57_CORCC|nr:hypothetical protein BS50DRAFT_625007 [Corynespora cassiicola Philippines]